MAEAEQNFVENNEQQIFSIPEFDNPHLAGDAFDDQDITFDQQHITGEVPIDYQFAGEESEDKTMVISEEGIGGNEPENDFGVIPEQNFAENENEHTDGENGDQGIHGLDEDQFKQGLTEDEAKEMGLGQVVSDLDKKNEQENNLAGVEEEKKWPGWPGESVFRMLVPGQKVGNVIGRKGEYIKKIVEETRARIKVLDGPPGSQERAVMVSAKEEPDSPFPPAMDGLLRVHRRIVDGLDGDSSQAQAPPAGGKVSTRLLVPATQAGSLIGKQGASVKAIQEAANCIVRVLGQADLPAFALQDDRVVEVVGEAVEVHKAIELIASQLRKFLVDRGIIPIFEKQMQALSNPREQHIPPQPWGPPHGFPPSGGVGHGGYGSNMQYMPPPRQLDNFYPPAEMAPPPDRQPHQGISAFGREPPVGAHASSNAQAAPSMITKITQHMQVPLIHADAVIGSNGATISYIRRASGATVTIQETRGVPGEMTVEINGTASQVQAAQQLIQNFMAEAAASKAATQTSGTADQGYSQGYNTFAAPPSVYGSTPSSGGLATQPGAYGAMYGGGYGYQI